MGACCSSDKKKQDKKSRKKAKLDECAQLKACCCCCGSLPCLKDPHDDPNYVSKVYNTRLIGYDDYGNLRYKIDPAHVGDDEISQILALDSTNRDGRDLWYVVDACWVNEWLLFVHTDKIVAPSPGPVYNRRLLMTDQETGKLVPKPDLVCEGTTRIGDYRRVSQETWEQFVALYPGSGPPITTYFHSEIDAAAAAAAEAKNRVSVDDETKEPEEEVTEETKAKLKQEEEWRKTGLYPTDNWLIGDAIYEDEEAPAAPTSIAAPVDAPASAPAPAPAPVMPPSEISEATTLLGGGAAAEAEALPPPPPRVEKKATSVTKVAPKKKVNEDLYNDIYSEKVEDSTEEEGAGL